MLLFILLPIEINVVTQEKKPQKNAVKVFGSGNGKIILILLAKVVTFYIRLIIIHIR